MTNTLQDAEMLAPLDWQDAETLTEIPTESATPSYIAHGRGVIAVAYGGEKSANGQQRGSYVQAESIDHYIPKPYNSPIPKSGNKETDHYRTYEHNWEGAIIFRQNGQTWLDNFEQKHPHIVLGAE